MGEDVYDGRLQTEVKHKILKDYLTKMGYIIGRKWSSITYVDCFAGPWKSKDPEFKDTSPAIAIKVLQEIEQHYQKQKPNFRVRCFFIEKDKESYSLLENFTQSNTGSLTPKIKKGSFENSIDDIVNFINAENDTFPFLFIDPTGWKNIPFGSIQQIINRTKNCEILLNLMTSQIQRPILNSKHSGQPSLQRLMGTNDYIERIKKLIGEQNYTREDAIACVYCENLQNLLNKFTCTAGILNSSQNRMHFNLIFLTNALKGITVFKEVERLIAQHYEKKRKNNIDKEPTGFLFSEMENTTPHYDNIRDLYINISTSILNQIRSQGNDSKYNDLLYQILQLPFVWESDLKDWIKINFNSISITSNSNVPIQLSKKFRVKDFDIKNDLTLSFK